MNDNIKTLDSGDFEVDKVTPSTAEQVKALWKADAKLITQAKADMRASEVVNELLSCQAILIEAELAVGRSYENLKHVKGCSADMKMKIDILVSERVGGMDPGALSRKLYRDRMGI